MNPVVFNRQVATIPAGITSGRDLARPGIEPCPDNARDLFRGRIVALVLAMAVVVCPATMRALDLVKDGKPLATIVTATAPDSPPPSTGRGAAKRKGAPATETSETTAARVLVDWIRKITDVELPVTNIAGPSGNVILVGQAALNAGLNLDHIQSPTREGLRILADERRVLIAGQSEVATLKAACRFLEALGCRYFMDGPLGEVHPRSRSLSIGPLDLTEKPGLLGRNPKGPSWRPTLWKTWNGAGGEVFQHQHAWGNYVGDTLFAEHPELFALGADGRRKAGQWLCTSNKELRRYFAERVVRAIRNGTRNPSISPPDGRGYCQCPACKAQDDPKSIEPSSGVVSMSNRYVDFFDDIARRVAAMCPDSVLSFYCYADYTQPPTAVRRLSPNLCAVIAPIRYCRLHEIGHAGCPSREQQVAMVEGWAAVASRLGYYNYMYNLADGTLPFFKFTPCQKEFPYLHARGLCTMTIEVLSNWHIYGPQIYLSLRLAYDPAADAGTILEDYCQKFYGPQAAPFMKQYWLGIDAAAGRADTHAGSFYGLQQIYTPAFLQRCDTLVGKAAAAAQGEPVYAQRVALHAEGLQSAVEYRQISDGMNRGDFSRANEIYDRMFSRLQGLARKGWANPEYATAYLERFLSKSVRAGAAAMAPPSRLLQVLPDPWRFALDTEDRGLERGWQTAAFDDSSWVTVSTHDTTLDTQGLDRNTFLWYRATFRVPDSHGPLALFFVEVDGFAEVYVNGRRVEPTPGPDRPSRDIESPRPSPPPAARPRTPFELDITDAVHSGTNIVAVRVDHTKITELALGGILRPVLLIEKPAFRGP